MTTKESGRDKAVTDLLPFQRTDGPTQYDYAFISPNEISSLALIFVLKRPGYGIDGNEVAEFIIQACNSYEALVNVCKNALHILTRIEEAGTYRYRLGDYINELRTAIHTVEPPTYPPPPLNQPEVG